MAKALVKYTELRQERDFGEILNATFDFVFKNFGNFFKVIFSIVGPVFIAATMVMSFFGYRLFNRFISSFTRFGRYRRLYESFFTDSDWVLLGVSVLTLIIGFLLLYMTAYGYIQVYNETRNPNVETRAVWLFVRRNFFRYIGSGFVLIIFFAANLTLLSFIMSSGISFFIILGWLGFFSLIIFQSLFFAILSFESFNPARAIGRGFSLVMGNWWFTFGIALVFFLLTIVLNYAIQFGGTIIFALLRINSYQQANGMAVRILSISIAVLTAISYIIMGTIGVVKNALVYFSLSEEKDSIGLMEKLEQISGESSPTTPNITVEKNKSQYSSEETEEDY